MENEIIPRFEFIIQFMDFAINCLNRHLIVNMRRNGEVI